MRSCLSRVGDMEVAVRESQSFQQRSLGAGWGLGGATLMNLGSRPAGEAPAGGAGWTRGTWKWSPCREVRAGRPRLSALGECEQAPPLSLGPLGSRTPQPAGPPGKGAGGSDDLPATRFAPSSQTLATGPASPPPDTGYTSTFALDTGRIPAAPGRGDPDPAVLSLGRLRKPKRTHSALSPPGFSFKRDMQRIYLD